MKDKDCKKLKAQIEKDREDWDIQLLEMRMEIDSAMVELESAGEPYILILGEVLDRLSDIEESTMDSTVKFKCKGIKDMITEFMTEGRS